MMRRGAGPCQARYHPGNERTAPGRSPRITRDLPALHVGGGVVSRPPGGGARVDAEAQAAGARGRARPAAGDRARAGPPGRRAGAGQARRARPGGGPSGPELGLSRAARLAAGARHDARDAADAHALRGRARRSPPGLQPPDRARRHLEPRPPLRRSAGVPGGGPHPGAGGLGHRLRPGQPRLHRGRGGADPDRAADRGLPAGEHPPPGLDRGDRAGRRRAGGLARADRRGQAGDLPRPADPPGHPAGLEGPSGGRGAGPPPLRRPRGHGRRRRVARDPGGDADAAGQPGLRGLGAPHPGGPAGGAPDPGGHPARLARDEPGAQHGGGHPVPARAAGRGSRSRVAWWRGVSRWRPGSFHRPGAPGSQWAG